MPTHQNHKATHHPKASHENGDKGKKEEAEVHPAFDPSAPLEPGQVIPQHSSGIGPEEKAELEKKAAEEEKSSAK